MKTIGIICEYNPFHNGHAKQLRLIRERYGTDAVIVCLMSGNYVQRGEPAIFDKAMRAEAAVRCGADLVLELPITYALRSAEGFADGGVEILDSLGVDVLCFGCECGDDSIIMSTAKTLLTPEFDALLRRELERGVCYAAAREAAVASCLGMTDVTLLRSPNNILAVEYCKALTKRNSRMEPFAIMREGDYHGTAANDENPSASFLRLQMLAGGVWRNGVPAEAADLYDAAPRYTMAAGERAVLARVRTVPEAAFEALPFGSEGLWRKLMHACRNEANVEAIIHATKSKRYARTRIQRMLMCAYLGITESVMSAQAPYVRILAFNKQGRQLLHRFVKSMHESSTDGNRQDLASCETAPRVPLVNAGTIPPDKTYYAMECRASDLYTLFRADETRLTCGQEQKNRIFYQDLEKNTCNP